ncbi:MAG: hypothetical protein RTV31_02775 [Candidatus Thorarchaeota archaeon]
MIREVRAITIIVLSIIVLSPIVTTNWTLNGFPDVENKSNIASSFFEGLLEDPFFEYEPQVVVNGTSEEFTYSFHPSSGGGDLSYIEMDWTHVENTELDFRGVDPEGVLPDYNDFIYTYQEFEFPYEVRPSNAEISLNYSIHLTGDFVYGVQEGNNLMFKVYVWVIDSSGNWYRIYASIEDVYSDEYEQRYLNLNYFNLVDIFDGMIEEEGVQGDPTDTAILAIGLAPTYRFESYQATNPWTFYDGSVSLRVSYADLYVAIEIPSDPSTLWQPMYNETYGTTVGEVFPLHENATDDCENDCFGIEVGPDGAVYVTGNTRSSYALSTQGVTIRHQILLKYDPSLNLLWKVENDNMTQVRSMYIHGDYIYTTGYISRDDAARNLIVTKWSSSGERVWQSEWGGEYSQVGVAVGVQSNGSIYVICSEFNQFGEAFDDKIEILKFDEAGHLLWNRTSQYFWTLYDKAGELTIFEDYFEYHLRTGIGFGGRFYFNGTESYMSAGNIVVPDEEGGYYTTSLSGMIGSGDEGTIIFLEHYNSTDTIDWRTEYSESWPNGWRYALTPRDIVLTPDDKLHLLVQHTVFSYDYLLLTYDLDGNLQENRTIGDESWPYWSYQIFSAIGSSGLVYFAFTIYIGAVYTADLCVQSFEFYETEGAFNLTVTTIIIIASTVVIIGASVGILRWKRRNS